MCVFTRNSFLTFTHYKNLLCYAVVPKYTSLESGQILKNQEQGDYESELYNNLNKDIINGGYVNAYIDVPDDLDLKTFDIYQCNIPKEVEFIVSDNLKEVAAKEIIVKGKIGSVPSFDFAWAGDGPDYPTRFDYIDCLRYELYKNNKKDGFIGYFVCDNCNIINPYDYIGDGKNVVGIICNVHDGVAKVLGLKEKKLSWCTLPCDKTKIVTKKPQKHKKFACQDLNGYQNCEQIRKSKKFFIGNYPALEFTMNYSTSNYPKGRWYIPSAGDVIAFVRNEMLKINLSLAILKHKGGDCDLLNYDWYWSSTELHENGAWEVEVSSGFLGTNVKSREGGVRPITIINLNKN